MGIQSSAVTSERRQGFLQPRPRISLIPHAILSLNGLQGITTHFAILVSGKNHRKTAGGPGSPGPLFFVALAVTERRNSAGAPRSSFVRRVFVLAPNLG